MKRHENTIWYYLAGTSAVLVLLALAAYNWRATLESWQLSDHQAAFWGMIVKATAGVLTIPGAIILIIKYLDEKAATTRAAEREARKDFSVKQQQIYFDLITVTAEIGNAAPDLPERIEAEKKFWRLYWGPILMVEDHDVEAAVDAFSVALYDSRYDSTLLLNKSMDLARACRTSLGDTWRVEQKILPERAEGVRSDDPDGGRARAV